MILLVLAASQFPLGLLGFGLLELGNESFIVGFIAVIAAILLILLTAFLLSSSTNHNFPLILLLDRLGLLPGLPNEQRSEKIKPGKSNSQTTNYNFLLIVNK